MAYIDFDTKQEKDAVLKAEEDLELDGKKLEIKDPYKTLFVGNIPYSSTEEDLEKFFEDCGAVKIQIIYINGRSKGYAHVTFQDDNAVELALKKNGEKILDRSIKIERIKPKNALQMQNRGRRGGYRGRGRGGPSYGFFDRERKDGYYRERNYRDNRNDRDRDRHRDWERGRPYNRIRERERDRDWNNRRERSRDKSRDYYKIRDRERYRDRGDRERSYRDRERVDRERGDRRERERDIDIDRERERDRSERGDRGRERERERGDSERERERDIDRERDRDRSERGDRDRRIYYRGRD